jgi:hypothetical protein
MLTALGAMVSGRNGSTKRTLVPIRNVPQRVHARATVRAARGQPEIQAVPCAPARGKPSEAGARRRSDDPNRRPLPFVRSDQGAEASRGPPGAFPSGSGSLVT